MRLSSLFVLVALLNCCVYVSPSLIGDFISASGLWPRSKELSTENKPSTLPKIRFELPKENEEFIRDGLNLISAAGRGELDKCNHRVILSLKKSCSQLSTEEIGKLSVMLLNCQLESEGRETFLCRPEMTLAECTTSMNEKMYQIYHHMTARASAVCTALKQDQMRMLTEITINRLAESSQSQMDILHESVSNQKLLYEKSKVNMKEHDESHDKIMEAHMANLDHLKIAESMINDNIENLQRDLDMRKKSEAQLDEIDQTIHGISVKLIQQSAQIHATQQLFLEDVDKISEAFRRHNQVILEQHRETLSYLESLRDIIVFLSSIVESINQFRMRVIDILKECGLEISQDIAILLTMNFTHFLAAMVLLIFLELKSKLPKRMLIATFTFNSASIVTRANLPLLSLNILVWFTYVTVRVLKVVKRKVIIFYAQWRTKRNQNIAAKMSFKRAQTPQNFDHQRRSPTPAILMENRPKSRNEQRQPSVNNLDDDSEMEMIFQKTETVPASRPMTPAMKRVISESYIPEQNRSIPTPFQTGLKGRIQCVAKTTKGPQCKNAAVMGLDKCRIHGFQ